MISRSSSLEISVGELDSFGALILGILSSP
jgi:hypothetical protein